MHPKLPPAVWSPVCPMRSLKTPEAQEYLPQFFRARFWNTLPVAGGLDDQPARTMEAFDVLAAALEERVMSRRRPGAGRGGRPRAGRGPGDSRGPGDGADALLEAPEALDEIP